MRSRTRRRPSMRPAGGRRGLPVPAGTSWPSWSAHPGAAGSLARVTNRGTGIGSMPGTDLAGASRILLGGVGDLPALVELPDRGPAASMTGRAVGLVTNLAFDLQPAGWRLTGTSGVDQRRAASLLSQDLDVTEELASDRRGRYKLQVAGP